MAYESGERAGGMQQHIHVHTQSINMWTGRDEITQGKGMPSTGIRGSARAHLRCCLCRLSLVQLQ